MTERAAMGLFQRPKVGTAHIQDITWACWPTYQRTSLAIGGDWAARFTVSGVSDHILEQWYADYLGTLLKESFGGVTTFKGILHSMRLAYRGDVHSITLDDMANKIACYYTPDSGGRGELTSFYSDTDSINTYGTRTLIISPEREISQTEAEQRAQAKLAQLAWPRSVPNDMGPWDGGPGSLEVEVIGLVRTLNGILQNSTDETTDDADTAITNMLSGADFVSAGTLESNTTQIARVADQEPTWDRIVDIVANDDSNESELWLAGCYASDQLDYYELDETVVTYYRDMKRGQRVILDAGGADVPAPLVQPGGIAFTRDIMVGQTRSATLRNDPRSAFIASVAYDAKGARLRGTLDARDRAAVLSMALAQQMNGT